MNMKQALKRIEATLHHLETVDIATNPQPAANKRTYSFKIHRPDQSQTVEQPLSDSPTQNLDASQSSSTSPRKSFNKVPNLPTFNSISNSCEHLVANPPLETNPAPAVPTDVKSYTVKLEQVVQQIQDLYQEGPIVDGWLESHLPAQEPTAGMLRHGAVEELMDYVEEVCSFEHRKVICESPRASYRLCGMEASGRKWSHPCPPEQVPSVSLAIARYQKLQQLLQQKRHLESKLAKNAQ